MASPPGVGTCTVPAGYAFVPIGPPGTMYFSDGFNLVELPYPANPTGQHLVATPSGPAWANQ